jgi:hypothetical protein
MIFKIHFRCALLCYCHIHDLTICNYNTMHIQLQESPFSFLFTKLSSGTISCVKLRSSKSETAEKIKIVCEHPVHDEPFTDSNCATVRLPHCLSFTCKYRGSPLLRCTIRYTLNRIRSINDTLNTE